MNYIRTFCQITQNSRLNQLSCFQHPGLTPGQKRFLYSIAEAYSKEHMRQLIRQHYMNVLHRCIRTGEPSRHMRMGFIFPVLARTFITLKYDILHLVLRI